MGLFRRDDQEQDSRPKNPDAYFGFKLLAAGYLLYLVWDMIKMYREGGPDQPSVILLICSVVVLGGGALFIAISSYRLWRKFKQEAADEAAMLAEAEAAEEDEEFEEIEEIEEAEETEEAAPQDTEE